MKQCKGCEHFVSAVLSTGNKAAGLCFESPPIVQVVTAMDRAGNMAAQSLSTRPQILETDKACSKFAAAQSFVSGLN